MKLPTPLTRLLLFTALSSVGFPIAACAARPTPHAPDATPQPQPTAQTNPSPQDSPDQSKDQNARQKDKQKAARDMQIAIDRNRSAYDAAARNLELAKLSFDARSPIDKPTLLITQPLDPHAADEWTEDLKIMDRLLRNAVTHTGDEDVPVAMGIKLTLFGHIPPTYIEDCGVLFTFGVNFPLAPAANAAGKSAQPPEPDSAWDRAKRELDTRRGPAASAPESPTPLPFDQSKVDTLLNSIINILPQAANFRHLDESNFIFVTITSTDTARTPLRMTLKAKKSDINDAFHKTISPDDFKKRVTWHIG